MCATRNSGNQNRDVTRVVGVVAVDGVGEQKHEKSQIGFVKQASYASSDSDTHKMCIQFLSEKEQGQHSSNRGRVTTQFYSGAETAHPLVVGGDKWGIEE